MRAKTILRLTFVRARAFPLSRRARESATYGKCVSRVLTGHARHLMSDPRVRNEKVSERYQINAKRNDRTSATRSTTVRILISLMNTKAKIFIHVCAHFNNNFYNS